METEVEPHRTIGSLSDQVPSEGSGTYCECCAKALHGMESCHGARVACCQASGLHISQVIHPCVTQLTGISPCIGISATLIWPHLQASPSATAQNHLMEPGELFDTAPTVSAIPFGRMEQRLSHMRRWVNHLVGKVRNLGNENSMLRELTYRQAKRIERLEEGILVRSLSTHPPGAGH